MNYAFMGFNGIYYDFMTFIWIYPLVISQLWNMAHLYIFMMIYPSQINKIQLAMSSKQRVHFIDLLFTMYGPMGNKWVTIFIANWVIYI